MTTRRKLALLGLLLIAVLLVVALVPSATAIIGAALYLVAWGSLPTP